MAASSTAEDHHGKEHDVGGKLKLPFHELKDKMKHSSHLQDTKVHLIHQKYVGIKHCSSCPRNGR